MELETSRLLLRQWRPSDLENWIAMGSSADVMRYFPELLSQEKAEAMFHRLHDRIEKNGWGLWALEVKNGDPFIGFIGLAEQDLGLPWMPCIEIGWRLKESAWGQGFATEGAAATLAFGVERFDKIYSYTSAVNLPSRRVMQSIGLLERPELAFEHPRVENAELKPHVVYST